MTSKLCALVLVRKTEEFHSPTSCAVATYIDGDFTSFKAAQANLDDWKAKFIVNFPEFSQARWYVDDVSKQDPCVFLNHKDATR